MPIFDGYSRRLTLPDHGLRIIYRPAALEHERRRFRYDADFLRSARVVSEWIAGHIVGSDSEMGNLELVRSLEGDAMTYRQLFLTVQGMLPDDSGEAWKDVEASLAENLRNGVELELLNLLLARRSCEDCQRDWYDEKTGLVILRNTGEPMARFGPTPCQVDGCLKGTPENQKSLSKQNKWCWRHFRDCEAVAQFPDDSLVKRNALIIRRVMKSVETKRSKGGNVANSR